MAVIAVSHKEPERTVLVWAQSYKTRSPDDRPIARMCS